MAVMPLRGRSPAPPPAGEVGRIRLPGDRASVAAARDFAARQLVRWRIPSDEAVQVVGELTGEAVRGGATVITLTLRRLDRRLGVDVSDDVPRHPFAERTARYAPGRRGHQIVERLSAAWECTLGERGRTMRAELPLRRRSPITPRGSGPDRSPRTRDERGLGHRGS